MGKLTTHVLDTAQGKPGAGIAIELYRLDGDTGTLLAKATTNRDGRTDPRAGDDRILRVTL